MSGIATGIIIETDRKITEIRAAARLCYAGGDHVQACSYHVELSSEYLGVQIHLLQSFAYWKAQQHLEPLPFRVRLLAVVDIKLLHHILSYKRFFRCRSLVPLRCLALTLSYTRRHRS